MSSTFEPPRAGHCPVCSAVLNSRTGRCHVAAHNPPTPNEDREAPRTVFGHSQLSKNDVVRAYTDADGITDWAAVSEWEDLHERAKETERTQPARMAAAEEALTEALRDEEAYRLPQASPPASARGLFWHELANHNEATGLSGRVIRGYRHWRNKR
jgi:hypothetical protein